jgi:hypothetical protein
MWNCDSVIQTTPWSFHWFMRLGLNFSFSFCCLLMCCQIWNLYNLRASSAVLSMWLCKSISHIQVLVIYFFPTPPIKLKLGLQIATHMYQSNYLANQKQGALNKYNLTIFCWTLTGSFWALEDVHFSRITVDFQWIHWIWLLHHIQDFQCSAIRGALVEMLIL